jgi:hypothetical protein
MFVITSIKKNIRALSELNGDVAFHNKLFDTDDCVITEEPNPTPEEVEAMKAAQEVQEIKGREIAQKKSELAISDYKILKKLEKLLPADDVDVIERQGKRNRINELEAL